MTVTGTGILRQFFVILAIAITLIGCSKRSETTAAPAPAAYMASYNAAVESIMRSAGSVDQKAIQKAIDLLQMPGFEVVKDTTMISHVAGIQMRGSLNNGTLTDVAVVAASDTNTMFYTIAAKALTMAAANVSADDASNIVNGVIKDVTNTNNPSNRVEKLVNGRKFVATADQSSIVFGVSF